MLNGVHLVDFGNHRNTRLTFGRMTALVGQNGAGKTMVMRAVQKLCFAAGRRDEMLQMSTPLVRSGSPACFATTSWPMAWGSIEGNCGVHLWGNAGANFATVIWLWATNHMSGKEKWLPIAGPISDRDHVIHLNTTPPQPGKRETNPLFFQPNVFRISRPTAALGSAVRGCRYFKISALLLQRPAFVETEARTLNSDGSNLAWALTSLMTEDPERFLKIVEALRDVVPVVRRIRSRAVTLKRMEKQTITMNGQERTFDEERTVPGQELIFDMKSGDNLPATMVSEGTLVALAVLTLVHGTDEADLIMLDDVELGLHPKAQRDLIRQLRRIQETHPRLQIILSTHSPYVVDELKPEEVWVFAPDADGCAVTHRLDEHPNAKRALEVLTTGEFWSAEGEGWVLKADPTEVDSETTAHVAEESPRE